MNKIKLILISKLKPHEKTIPENLEKIKNEIYEKGYLANPVIIDQKNLVILDGHHRVKALELLGYKKVPACLVDYFAKEIKVFPRRLEISISKDIVIAKALAGEVFPHKTTKHLISGRPRSLNVTLKKLR
jgi:hypothetical protein